MPEADQIDTVSELLGQMSPPLGWVELANREITELQEAAKADPKTFFGNRVRGMGDGLSRVRALLYASKNIEQALVSLNRVL